MRLEVRLRKTFVAILRLSSSLAERLGRELSHEEIVFLAGLGLSMATAPENEGLSTDHLFEKGLSSITRLTQ